VVMDGGSERGDGRCSEYGGDGPFNNRGLDHDLSPWEQGPVRHRSG
jgi:hypothetical protein